MATKTVFTGSFPGLEIEIQKIEYTCLKITVIDKANLSPDCIFSLRGDEAKEFAEILISLSKGIKRG